VTASDDAAAPPLPGALPDAYEQAFRLYRVEGRTCKAVAEVLNTSTAGVIRWARRFEKEQPARAAAMLGGTPGTAVASAVCSVPGPVGKTPAGLAWLQRATPPSEPPAPPPADDEDDELEELPPGELPEDATALQIVKRQIRELRSFIDQARRLGNLEVVQRFTRSLVELVNAQRQLEKSARADDGLIVVSKGDIDAALKEIDGKVASLEDAELRCSDCGRIMRRRKADE
jgi:hypothetical protein